MKILQEYSDDGLVSSISLAVRRIEKLPLPYTGNKKKLLTQFHDALIQNNVEFSSVLDAFTGSATIAYLFKLMGKRVLANDLLTSSYLNAVAFVENPGIRLSDEEKEFLLHHQNPNKGTFVEDNYLGVQFRPPGKTCRFNKFTLKECMHLDNFRSNIDELCNMHAQSIGLAANAAVVLRLPFGNVDQSADIMTHRNRQQSAYGEGSENYDRRIGIYYDEDLNLNFDKWFNKYVGDFIAGVPDTPPLQDDKIKRAAFLVNLQQHVLRDCMVQGRFHYGQALAELDVRLGHQKNQLKSHWSNLGSTEMDFLTRAGTESIEGKPGQGLKFWTFADVKAPGSCLAVNMDVTELLKSDFCKVDCAYFDPPYGGQSSDYSAIYRFLEEYIYSSPLEELPHIKSSSSKFVRKKNYEENFKEMLQAAMKIPTWLFSYNDNSWRDVNYISDIIREFKKDVQVVVLTDDYRYLYRKKQGRENKSSEYLIIAR